MGTKGEVRQASWNRVWSFQTHSHKMGTWLNIPINFSMWFWYTYIYIYIMILGHISLIINMFVVFDCQRVNTCLMWSTFGACLGSMLVNVWHRCTSWSTQSLFQNGNAPPVTLPNTFPTEQTKTGVRFASGTANNLSPIEARTWYLPYASVCSEAAIGLQS